MSNEKQNNHNFGLMRQNKQYPICRLMCDWVVLDSDWM